MTSNPTIHHVRTLLLLNVLALVDIKEKAEVQVIQGPQTTIFRIVTDKTDVGKVIGKKGATISALRTLLKCWTSASQFRAIIQFDE